MNWDPTEPDQAGRFTAAQVACLLGCSITSLPYFNQKHGIRPLRVNGKIPMYRLQDLNALHNRKDLRKEYKRRETMNYLIHAARWRRGQKDAGEMRPIERRGLEFTARDAFFTAIRELREEGYEVGTVEVRVQRVEDAL